MMRRSALAHFAEIRYNRLEARWLRSHAVSEALVKEMAAIAKSHHVTFIVANIVAASDGTGMLDFATANGIANVDISVDLDLPENTNRPHDNHPSAAANRKYADRLEKFLRAKLAEEDSSSPARY
jgi:hypothetical protein